MTALFKEQKAETNRWFSAARPLVTPVMRLFCFPYAGGSAWVYQNWHKSLPPQVEVQCAHLPGRGPRIMEKPITQLSETVDYLVEAIEPLLDSPFCFFGHSMGGRIAFELARKLREKGLSLPKHLFISATPAPRSQIERKRLSDLPADEFLEQLKKFNGTPVDVLDNPELMALIEPILRADFEAVETWQYAEDELLDIPFTLYGGKEDPMVKYEHLDLWREETSANFQCRMFSGDHFFINENQQALLSDLSMSLQHVAAR